MCKLLLRDPKVNPDLANLHLRLHPLVFSNISCHVDQIEQQLKHVER
jgi:hypothetical protein